METSQPKFPMRVYSAQELSKIYNVCKKTFMRWIQPFTEVIGERRGRYYTINQVKIIVEKLGTPEGFAD
jgi:hypothetical protein